MSARAPQEVQVCSGIGLQDMVDVQHNAVIESWHSTLEWELRSLREFATRGQARAEIAAWIEDYNHVRLHSALGMKSPVAWEQAAGRDQENEP